MFQPQIIILPLLISFFITALASFLAIPLIKKAGLVDDPKKHKHPAILHTKIIPRAGGVPLFIGVWLTLIFFLPINQIIIGLFVASLISLIIGTLDDKYDLSRYLRLGINVFCALIVILSGIHIPFVTNPAGGILLLDSYRISIGFISLNLADIIAMMWIVWVMNALNWSKGVDGQMPGVVAISAIVIGLLSLRFPISDPNTHIAVILSFIIAGAALGFLIFNFYPAKIFPGYGATSIYLLLAVVSILSTAKLATAILVMGVPMVDGLFTVFRRIFTGKSPFWHDKKHLHHLMLKLGFGQRRIALFYWIVSAILGAIALVLTSKQKVFAIIMLVVGVGMVILFLQIALRNINDEHETK